jgi:hypothetical protein
MDTDPYFVTQDNGAGAPIHFATTYKQLDMVRRNHILGVRYMLHHLIHQFLRYARPYPCPAIYS